MTEDKGLSQESADAVGRFVVLKSPIGSPRELLTLLQARVRPDTGFAVGLLACIECRPPPRFGRCAMLGSGYLSLAGQQCCARCCYLHQGSEREWSVCALGGGRGRRARSRGTRARRTRWQSWRCCLSIWMRSVPHRRATLRASRGTLHAALLCCAACLAWHRAASVRRERGAPGALRCVGGAR